MDIAIRQEAGPCRSVANATQSNKVTGCRGRETWGFLDWPHTFSKGISRVAALGLGVALASAARCHNSKGWVEGVILVTHNGRRVDHAGFVDSSPKLSAGRYTLRRGLCRHGRVPLSESSV